MKINLLKFATCFLPKMWRKRIRENKIHADFVRKYWPEGWRTSERLLPLLPDSMKSKLIVAKELFNHCNTTMGDDLYWNHVITLPLVPSYDVTFSIPDKHYMPESLKEEVSAVIDTYKSLQLLYTRFGNPLNIVGLQTDDFGMYLPGDFFDPLAPQITEECVPYVPTIEEFIERLLQRQNNDKEVNEQKDDEQIRLDWYNNKGGKKICETGDSLQAIIDQLSNDYFVDVDFNGINIYCNKSKIYGREVCIKWNVNDDVETFRKLDELRPLIDKIVKDCKRTDFAFGVKRRGATVHLLQNGRQT